MDAFSSSEHSSDDEDPEGNNRPRTSRSAGMQPLSRNPAASVQLTAGGSRPAQPPVARAQAQVSNLGPTSQSQRNSEAARVAQLETTLYSTQRALRDSEARAATLGIANMTLTDQHRRRRRTSDDQPAPASITGASTGTMNAAAADDDSDDAATSALLDAKQKAYLKIAYSVGQQFGLFNYPFVPKSYAEQLKRDPPVVVSRSLESRFLSYENNMRVVLYDGWKGLAEADRELRRQLGYDPLIAARWCKGIGQEKSRLVYAGAQNGGKIFSDLGVDASIFTSAEGRHDCEALRNLGPQDEDDMFPPVLMPADHPEDGRYLFRTERLTKLLLCALFGNSAIGKKGRRARNTKGDKWQATEATPGLIVLGAVVLIYFTSGDSRFEPMGESEASKRWDYQWWYDRYLKHVLGMVGTPGYGELMNFVNERVFNNRKRAPGQRQQANTANDEVRARNERMLAMLGKSTANNDMPPATSASGSSSSAPVVTTRENSSTADVSLRTQLSDASDRRSNPIPTASSSSVPSSAPRPSQTAAAGLSVAAAISSVAPQTATASGSRIVSTIGLGPDAGDTQSLPSNTSSRSSRTARVSHNTPPDSSQAPQDDQIAVTVEPELLARKGKKSRKGKEKAVEGSETTTRTSTRLRQLANS